jgi:hypothetical protein
MSYTGVIEQDSNGELVLVFPDDLLKELDWKPDDTLLWKQLDDDRWTLTKYEDSDS